ncbi:MAG TPA: DoxX family protein [Usitatibacter sp.]|nr:DoxX family protein [Usitatibacter sp.]
MQTTLTSFQSTWQPRALGALRIVAGYLFIAHGTTKLFQAPYIEMFANVPLLSLAGVAGMLEVFGGALLILGLLTRPAAFVLSGLMAFAYFIGHAPQGNVLLPILNAGELAVLYSFLFLFISVAGPGAWALDNHLKRNPHLAFLSAKTRAGQLRSL